MSEPADPDTSYYPYIPLVTSLPNSSIPSCAQWFDVKGIHELEEGALPEFFRKDHPVKTPANYMKFRNFTIKEYRANPSTYLSATMLRKKLLGDAYSIVRIHSFLEHWGLINFHAPKPYSTATYDFAPPGHSSHYRKRLYEILRPFCAFCGFVCDVVWFTDKLNTDYCSKCYSKGYATDCEENDLDRRFPFEAHEELWNYQKLHKMMEILRDFGEDWDRVVLQTGNNKEECIGRFLNIPIEELIEFEDAKIDDYDNPLYELFNDPPLKVDVQGAIDNAKELKRVEEAHINNCLNRMNELLIRNIQIKSRFIKELNDIGKLKDISYKLKLQQLFNKQYSFSTN